MIATVRAKGGREAMVQTPKLAPDQTKAHRLAEKAYQPGRNVMNRPLANNISILAFDVFGTVVDWHQSIMREVRSMNLDVDPDRFALAWRAGYVRPCRRSCQGSSAGR